MKYYTQCTNCGYDLYGPQYIANVVDSTLFNETNAYYPSNALLQLSSIQSDQLTCPNCNSKGMWRSV